MASLISSVEDGNIGQKYAIVLAYRTLVFAEGYSAVYAAAAATVSSPYTRYLSSSYTYWTYFIAYLYQWIDDYNCAQEGNTLNTDIGKKWLLNFLEFKNLCKCPSVHRNK